ncbi:Eco57I restriction-modification methylase domain-containing protein [Bizionia myxarmorum]|uniref:site-specific DNA-methyltransferase (adenine-specific) n=1 Tax=Bizionia myxarmorum TaxID=291186 RepID=A0A5D0R7D0_9FLAO|nr:DNA methyltransferase [Bizionia myxarmorum]TYB76845.1 N-6 DNA methylase [Bizionia myxarmorum]
MALFQSSVLKSHLALLDEKTVEKAYKNYQKYFWNATIQENIKSAKEEQYQATFLHELFVNILGYTLFPNPKANLTTEFKNEKNARKADGAISKDGAVVGVIELKGTNTKDLESIRKQAFDYKANHKGCVYIITSNFEKLRFYINDATEFEEFDLFTLSRERFNLLYLCLYIDKILNHVPLKIKEASIAEEEQITKAFYKDYSIFKRELYRDLVKRNSKTVTNKLIQLNHIDHDADILSLEKNVKLTLFKKSQKLIDRFLFIFFAEDRMLLPSNSSLQILNKWKDDWDFGDERPLYDLFKQYFTFLDIGRKGTEKRAEIYAYNGGLFKPDAILDALEIDNDLLHTYTLKLSNYDFESQVDVNILGHIFENSLNEIESVNAEIEGGDFDKQTSKRKKDGVFYTPKYITKYIVENTVGKLCNEKKAELGFDEEQYFKGRKNRNKSTIENLVNILDTYRNWLLQLTICDPACGSGAFLNQALDFLIKEHTYIDELKTRILGGGLQFPDIENTILENNIYGVDLNEESVEIAKLSLWLRTAQPRRKLNDLSSNIKCGNSLIDDKKVAGDKAFKWNAEFPDVFRKGGFDVVIGNPPYVRQELLNQIEKIYLIKTYKVGNGTADLYVYFYEKAINLLNNGGFLGFITPNKYIKTNYGKNLREFLSKSGILKIIDFGELSVFSDAATFPSILISRSRCDNDFFNFKQITSLKDIQVEINNEANNIRVATKSLMKSEWRFIEEEQSELITKMTVNSTSLGNLVNIKRGVLTGYNEAFIIDEPTKIKLIDDDFKSAEIIKPFLSGKDIRKNQKNFRDQFLIFTRRGVDISRYPAIKKHLSKFEKRLTPGIKGGRKKGEYEWYEIQDSVAYYEMFENNKIIYPEMAMESRFTYDIENFYTNNKCFIFNYPNSSLSALLNSKLIWFYLKNSCSVLGDPNNGGRLELRSNYMTEIPINNLFISQGDNFKILADKSIELTISKIEIISSFKDYLKSTLCFEKFTRKLECWHDIFFSEFIKELHKVIKNTNKERARENLDITPALTKKDEFEWMELFEENKKKANELQAQINQTEQEIDAMVYELYGLTEEEIAIVENS